MFLRPQYMYIFVGTFGGLALPNTKKLATLVTTHTFPLGAPPPPPQCVDPRHATGLRLHVKLSNKSHVGRFLLGAFISWHLRGLRVCYGVYVALTGRLPCPPGKKSRKPRSVPYVRPRLPFPTQSEEFSWSSQSTRVLHVFFSPAGGYSE